jgi:hypothetical protein
VLAGDAGVVDGVVEAELEALAGLVGTEEEELLVVVIPGYKGFVGSYVSEGRRGRGLPRPRPRVSIAPMPHLCLCVASRFES